MSVTMLVSHELDMPILCLGPAAANPVHFHAAREKSKRLAGPNTADAHESTCAHIKEKLGHMWMSSVCCYGAPNMLQ
eukprot:6212435-Amphidinium_carterae.1